MSTNDHDRHTLTRAVDEATARMSERERLAFIRGVQLGTRWATAAMNDTILELKNAVPDTLSSPVTMRRIAL